MRLITWNVGHQTRIRSIPVGIAAGLGALEPGVIVLTEYVEHASHQPFFDTLTRAGLRHREVSEYVACENQVLIATRQPAARGDICCDVDLSSATRPNWLHVVLPGGTHVVGFRRPMFTRKPVPRGESRYWQWFAEAVEPIRSAPAVLLGDFNCSATARCLGCVLDRGWTMATPNSGWSYKGKTGLQSSIDHALVSEQLRVVKADYVPQSGNCRFAGSQLAYSDHAPLVLEITAIRRPEGKT